MKMIILMVKDQLTETLTAALTSAQYRVTRIASTGGFLRSGTTTMLIGVDEGAGGAGGQSHPLRCRSHAARRAASDVVRGPGLTFRAGVKDPAPTASSRCRWMLADHDLARESVFPASCMFPLS